MTDKALRQEARDCYRFLMEHTNFEENSSGYGLTLDRMADKKKASTAGSGFMLSALVIGARNGWGDFEENRRRAYLTIKNYYENIPHFHGMFSHYLHFNNGERYKKSEFSTIDTVLFLNGMLTADSFFSCPDISAYARLVYERIDWGKFIFKYNNRDTFRMAYNDLNGGDYLENGHTGWIYRWSMMAEQLTMYILAAASPGLSSPASRRLFLGFERTVGGYKNHQFVYTPLGSLFVYHYSHAWFDFRKYYDMAGFDWFNNSVQAVLANKAYCRDRAGDFKTFAAGLWGLTACLGPKGYASYGAPPFTNYEHIDEFQERTDGTVGLSGILASLPFCAGPVQSVFHNFEERFPGLYGKYGLYDSINLDKNWIGRDYYSIDKGISLLMIDNYYQGTTWYCYMNHPLIKYAVEKLHFIRREESDGDN